MVHCSIPGNACITAACRDLDHEANVNDDLTNAPLPRTALTGPEVRCGVLYCCSRTRQPEWHLIVSGGLYVNVDVGGGMTGWSRTTSCTGGNSRSPSRTTTPRWCSPAAPRQHLRLRHARGPGHRRDLHDPFQTGRPTGAVAGLQHRQPPQVDGDPARPSGCWWSASTPAASRAARRRSTSSATSTAPASPPTTTAATPRHPHGPAASTDDPPAARQVLADFAGGTYGTWTATGKAFGTAPTTGTLPDRQQVSSWQGGGLVNTFLRGDATTRTLTSPSSPFPRRT